MGPSPTRDLQQIRHPSVREPLDSIERERRARAIAHEPLATLVVVSRDAHGTVDVEAVARCREAPLPAFHVCVGISFGRRGSRKEGAARERELHAPLLRIGLPRLVAAFLGRELVEIAVTTEPAERPVANASRHLLDVILRRRRRLVDTHAAVVGLLEDAEEGERVEMNGSECASWASSAIAPLPLPTGFIIARRLRS